MSIITLDFESYYDDKVGFKTQTTEEYVNDPQFEVIGVSVKVNREPTIWFSSSMEDTKDFLLQFNWKDSACLAHNMAFDGFVLARHFGIIPGVYLDTLSMARALHGVDAGGSLAALVDRYKLGVKGNEVTNAYGKHRLDFTPDELAAYGRYCVNDAELTFALLEKLIAEFPEDELKLIDLTIRMFTRPLLSVDDAVLLDRLDEIVGEKATLFRSLQEFLDVPTTEEVRAKLASNHKFAQVLRSFGVDPPMKVSPTTGKPTYAFAKNDEGFIALQEHENPVVQQICAVRLGTKATMEESRIERFIGIGARNRGSLPIPLKYYGAHTGRWAGSESVNFQNLPSRNKKKKALKNSLLAPKGHVVINSDSSSIEARILAWWSGQDDVVEAFRSGRDVYCEDATKVYGRRITEADVVERFVGKTMRLGLGYGTGAAKLRHTLKTQPPGADLSEDECRRLVYAWRDANSSIRGVWAECDTAIRNTLVLGEGHHAKPYSIGKYDIVKVSPAGIHLPNGLMIRYPGLSLDPDDNSYYYKSRKGKVKLWGGTVTENIVQALARIVVGQQMLKIAERYPVVLTVHDSVVVVAKEQESQEALDFIVGIMSTPPEWCTGLPVDCKAKAAKSYGECG